MLGSLLFSRRQRGVDMAAKIALAGIAVLTSVGAASAQTTHGKSSSTEYFKNYALSTCIADGYKAEEVVKDSAAAARGYLEFGSLPLEAHTEATLLGRKFLEKEYRSKSGEPMTLMKCIDFFSQQGTGSAGAEVPRQAITAR